MAVRYESPYHKLLADFLKDDDLTKTEKKIFEVLALAPAPLTRRKLAWMISDLESQISRLQDRVDNMRVCYRRQLKPFQELQNESKKSR